VAASRWVEKNTVHVLRREVKNSCGGISSEVINRKTPKNLYYNEDQRGR